MKFLIPTMVVFVLGCGTAPTGPKMFPVTGTLMIGDKPVQDVNVQLIPEDLARGTIISSGKTDASGKFSVIGTNGEAGAVVGKYKVVLSVAAATPQPGKAHVGPTPPAQAEGPFPKDYTSSTTSPKSIDVVDKAVTLDLTF